MKPWTRFEAFLGKIVKDPEALNISITPLTRLERYLEKFRDVFMGVPHPNQYVVGGYLRAISNETAVWVKPLTVKFTGTAGGSAFCSVPCREIMTAYEDGIPINAYYEVTSEDNEIIRYPLTMTKVYTGSEGFVFSCRYTEPNDTSQEGVYDALTYGEVSCMVYDEDDYVRIYADVPENSK